MKITKELLNKVVFFIIALVLTLYCYGCKDNTPKVKDVSYRDLQITSFSLSKKGDSYLSSIPFNIDQGYGKEKNKGSIYNSNKIEYGVEIDSVLLNITYSNESVSKIEYSFGEDPSSFKVFDPTKDSINIASDNNVLFLRLTSKNISDLPMTYRVDLYRHAFRSDEINYQSPTNGGNFPIGKWTQSIATAEGADIYTRHSENNHKYIFSQGTFTSDNIIMGIPSNETITHVEYVDENTAYAITDGHNVYKQESRNGVFNKMDILSNTTALLGKLNSNGKIVLALIRDDQDGIKYFSTFDGSSIIMGLKVPDDFPLTQFVSINSTQEWVGNSIHLLGGFDQNDSYVNKSWYTTNGSDWIRIAQSGLPENIIHSRITKYNDSLFQVITTADNDMKLFISNDNGITWSESILGLPTSDFDKAVFSSKYYTTFSISNDFYLIIGDTSSSSKIFKGKIRRLIE